EAERDGRVSGERRAELPGPGVQLVVDADELAESDPHGFLRVVNLSDQHHAERAAVADDARQALRPAAAGQDPEPDLRLSEPGRTGRDPEVARERELAPAAERVPVDLRDRRLRELGEDLEDPAPVHGIALLEGRAL